MSTFTAAAFRSWSITLGAIIAVSLSLVPSKSFAGPTTPTYLACVASGSFGLHLCTGAYQINKGAVPDPNAFVSWLIGSVETTQVAGTQAAYLAWLIGYPYTTLVAGSHSVYLACTLQTVLGITQCSATRSSRQ